MRWTDPAALASLVRTGQLGAALLWIDDIDEDMGPLWATLLRHRPRSLRVVVCSRGALAGVPRRLRFEPELERAGGVRRARLWRAVRGRGWARPQWRELEHSTLHAGLFGEALHSPAALRLFALSARGRTVARARALRSAFARGLTQGLEADLETLLEERPEAAGAIALWATVVLLNERLGWGQGRLRGLFCQLHQHLARLAGRFLPGTPASTQPAGLRAANAWRQARAALGSRIVVGPAGPRFEGRARSEASEAVLLRSALRVYPLVLLILGSGVPEPSDEVLLAVLERVLDSGAQLKGWELEPLQEVLEAALPGLQQRHPEALWRCVRGRPQTVLPGLARLHEHALHQSGTRLGLNALRARMDAGRRSGAPCQPLCSPERDPGGWALFLAERMLCGADDAALTGQLAEVRARLLARVLPWRSALSPAGRRWLAEQRPDNAVLRAWARVGLLRSGLSCQAERGLQGAGWDDWGPDDQEAFTRAMGEAALWEPLRADPSGRPEPGQSGPARPGLAGVRRVPLSAARAASLTRWWSQLSTTGRMRLFALLLPVAEQLPLQLRSRLEEELFDAHQHRVEAELLEALRRAAPVQRYARRLLETLALDPVRDHIQR